MSGVLPILYLQETFLLSLSPVFLNQFLPLVFWLLFFILAVFVAIRTRVNRFISIIFSFLSIGAISLYFLVGSTGKNEYLGKCGNDSVYKIGQIHLGDSSEYGLSVAKSQNFSLVKVPIYGILENNYYYKTKDIADKTWRIFREPQSDAKVNLHSKSRPLEKVSLANNLSSCPDLVRQIEQKYQIILSPKTLERIKSEFTVKLETNKPLSAYIEYEEFIRP